MAGRGFEAFGEAIMVSEDRVLVGSFGVVGPSYSVVRRDRGHRFELAVIASFNCPDGSLFIQEIAGPEQRQINDPHDGLTLTLLARDGNRYRFPPVVFPFAKPFTPPMEAQLKVTVLYRTSDSARETWNKHKRSLYAHLNAQAQRQFQAQHRRQLEAQRRLFEAQRQQQHARHQAAQRQFVAHHLVNPMQNMNLDLP